MASVDGPLAGTGDIVTYAYNAAHDLSSVTNQVGHVTQMTTHNGRGQSTTIVDPNGVTTAMTYDDIGRIKTITVNPGTSQAVTTFAYDAIGQITRITRPDGSYYTYTYDNARRLTAVTSSDGEIIEYSHDLMGNVTATTIKKADATITFSQTQMFDELGRLLKHIGAATQTTTYAYEKNDNLKTVTDPRSGVYTYAYDGVNRLISETNQESATVSYTLDGQGETTTYADPRSLQTTYVRNGVGEIIQRVSPDSGTTVYTRDAAGRSTQMTDARSIVTTYTYDNADRMLTRTYPAATTENVTYAYDATANGNKGKGRLTSVTDNSGSATYKYDVRGNIIQAVRTIGSHAHTVAYVYDLADRLTEFTYPSGRQVQYIRDTQGRITSVQTRKVSTDLWANIATGIAYQPMSRQVSAMSFANRLALANTFTQDHRLNALRLQDGLVDIINRTHTWDAALNLTGVTDSVTAANGQTFAYTAANRLTTATGPWGTRTFTYDAVGNRTQSVTTPIGGGPETNVLAYPATTNRLTSVTTGTLTPRQFAYDNAGNITSDTRLGSAYTYAYNHANRLSTVSFEGNLRATYTYNGASRLVTRVVINQGAHNGTTHFVHDLDGNIIAETDGSGATGTLREYIWVPSIGYAGTALPVANVDGVGTPSSTLYYVHTDHLSRPIVMTNSAKTQVWSAVWGAWGAPHGITGSLADDRRFPGQWFQIESFLHYNWHRHYDPTIGRYTQPDPLGFVDGPSVYAYARGNPQTLIDPIGRNTVAVGGGIGGAVGGPPGVIVGAGIGAGVTLFCLVYPEACKKALNQCVARVGGGTSGGGRDPNDECKDLCAQGNADRLDQFCDRMVGHGVPGFKTRQCYRAAQLLRQPNRQGLAEEECQNLCESAFGR